MTGFTVDHEPVAHPGPESGYRCDLIRLLRDHEVTRHVTSCVAANRESSVSRLAAPCPFIINILLHIPLPSSHNRIRLQPPCHSEIQATHTSLNHHIVNLYNTNNHNVVHAPIHRLGHPLDRQGKALDQLERRCRHLQYRPNRLDQGQLAFLFLSSVCVLDTDDFSFWIDVLRLQAKKGGFKDTCPEELLAAVLREAYTRAKLDPSKIE